MAELPQKHRVSVSGVLKILGVSRSGYRAWKQRVPSVSEKHRDHIKDAIKQIYDGSHQNYGAPKITEMLHRQGESIAEKTVGNYMRQMGIKAQWVKVIILLQFYNFVCYVLLFETQFVDHSSDLYWF